MEITLYLAFLLTSIAVIIVPGPNVLVIVSTSLNGGIKRGLQTVAGTSVAMSIQLVVAALASMSVIQFVEHGLTFLKWAGLLYLGYLAVSHWRQAWQKDGADDEVAETTAVWTFGRGFLVSISNPKTILFFTAFLPQFAAATYDYSMQIALLSISFLLLAAFFDSLYAVMAGKLNHLLYTRQRQRFEQAVDTLGESATATTLHTKPMLQRALHGVSGLLYAVAAIGLYWHSRSRV